MKYRLHPSGALNRAFAARPYQGAEPEKATFLFVGLDANYSPAIEQNAVFDRVLDYLEDGVAFWKTHGVHHPFLLPQYRGDGQKYHKTFARIGFRPEHAEEVSFIEMLHVPTVGQSKLTIDVRQRPSSPPARCNRARRRAPFSSRRWRSSCADRQCSRGCPRPRAILVDRSRSGGKLTEDYLLALYLFR